MKNLFTSLLISFLSFISLSQEAEIVIEDLDTTQTVYFKAIIDSNALMCPRMGPIAKGNIETLNPQNIKYHDDYETITFHLLPSDYKSKEYIKYVLNYSGYPEYYISVYSKNTPF